MGALVLSPILLHTAGPEAELLSARSCPAASTALCPEWLGAEGTSKITQLNGSEVPDC